MSPVESLESLVAEEEAEERVRVMSCERTQPTMLALKVEEGDTSQEIQVASRNWRRPGIRFFP